MPLTLIAAQTLALGPFNPHIITPDWLFKQSICDDPEVRLRFTPLSRGIAFRFKDVEWQIDFRHLLVASTTKDCGDFVAKVVEKLVHTPVRAVGNNFHYGCAHSEWGQSPMPMLGTDNAAVSVVRDIEQTRWGCVFTEYGARIEVTLASETDGVAALFNFHRVTKDAAETGAASREFTKDRQRSEELVKRLFKQGVAS